jgi:hypothetical protein
VMPLPFIMLTIILIFGATREGSADGIQEYIAKADWFHLESGEVRVDDFTTPTYSDTLYLYTVLIIYTLILYCTPTVHSDTIAMGTCHRPSYTALTHCTPTMQVWVDAIAHHTLHSPTAHPLCRYG